MGKKATVKADYFEQKKQDSEKVKKFGDKCDQINAVKNKDTEVSKVDDISYPPRTKKAYDECKKVCDALDNHPNISKQKPPAVCVFTHEDGTVSVGFAGLSKEFCNDIKEKLEKVLNKGLEKKKYYISDESIPLEIEEKAGGNKPGACAEPKAANAAHNHDIHSPIDGMETLWRNKKGVNKHPYTGELGEGLEYDPNRMAPCPTCADKENIKKYMSYANSYEKRKEP